MLAAERARSRGGRVAVIGDVAGHADELMAELRRLGADPATGRLPDDLNVVQVGDLVHRGPDSEGVVALVEGYLTEQPGQWVQLVGNHEAQYLAEPAFEWPERLGDEAVACLRRWWATGQMQVAASIGSATESFLLTHAGLTAGFWRQVLNAPSTVERTELALNSLIGRHDAVLFRPGSMLGGRRRDLSAGPLWAAAGTELVPSWAGTRLPFSQVHGHSSVVDWHQLRVRAAAPIVRVTTLDVEAKHATVTLPGGRIVGVDPGHGLAPRRPWRSFEIPS